MIIKKTLKRWVLWKKSSENENSHKEQDTHCTHTKHKQKDISIINITNIDILTQLSRMKVKVKLWMINSTP